MEADSRITSLRQGGKRRLLQFRLRTMLFVIVPCVALAAALLGWYRQACRHYQEDQLALSEILSVHSDGVDYVQQWRGPRVLAALGCRPTVFLRVTEFSLRDSLFAEQILPHLSKLKSLEDLCIADTHLGDAPLTHLAGLTSLKSLTIQDCDATESSMQYLQELRNLEKLHVSFAARNESLQYLEGLHALRTLELGYAELEGAGLAHLADLKHLEALSLSFVDQPDKGMSSLAQLRQLKKLRVYRSRCDASLKYIAKLPLLESLDFEESTVSEEGLEHLSVLGRLTHLRLSAVRITSRGLQHIQQLKTLKRLEFSRIPIDDASFGYLKHLTQLEELWLLDAEATGAPLLKEGVEALRDTEISRLNFRWSRLNDSGLHRMTRLPTLDAVDVRDTQVTRTAVDEFKKTMPHVEVKSDYD